MKLATYRDGSRDGQLVVVSRDLALAHYASGIATRLQQVLDDWNFLSPQLEDLAATLHGGKARHAFAFDPARCMAPLPRAYQWALGPGAAAGPPAGTGTGSCLGWPTQRASDDFLGPQDAVRLPGTTTPRGLQAGFAVVTGDLPLGLTPAQALERVRLVLLAHVWSLPGGVQPAGAFAPLAVTPDELGEAWREGRVLLDVRTRREAGATGPAGEVSPAHFGQPSPDFAALLAALSRVRSVRAGSIVGPCAEPAGPHPTTAPAIDPASGPGAQAWHDGDLAHSEATGPDGLSVFGALAQRVALAGEPATRA
jgi:fumarylacetoacetate (FAA) hydrolase